MSSILAIGHSHLEALEVAYQERLRTADMAGVAAIQFLQLLNAEFDPNLVTRCGQELLSDRLESHITSILVGFSPNVLMFCLSANEYHFVGMFNHPRRFDFALPECRDPLSRDAEIIPVELLETWFRNQYRRQITVARKIMALVGEPRAIAIQSPPPIPDNQYIIDQKFRHAFAVEIEQYGLSPPSFRRKLWLLQSRVFERMLTEVGVEYLRSPEVVLDAAGFMNPEGWRFDGVHGSTWYGEQVLRQIDELVRADNTREDAR